MLFRKLCHVPFIIKNNNVIIGKQFLNLPLSPRYRPSLLGRSQLGLIKTTDLDTDLSESGVFYTIPCIRQKKFLIFIKFVSS